MPKSKKSINKNKALIQFGKNLQKLRKAANLSQEGLGVLVNLHRTTIGELERGDQNISFLNMLRIAWVLRIDPAKLLEKIEPEPISIEQIKNNLSDQVTKIMSESRINYTVE
jgi:transcriptional regulator with XRE-family HTH domain